MGAIGGSISVRRYRVRGESPNDFTDRVGQRLAARAHTPIDPRGEEDRSVGWAAADDPFDTDLRAERVLFDNWLVVTMRVDTLRIPRAQMAPMLRERLQAHEHEEGEPPDRRTRRRIENEVKRALRLRVLPSVRTYDLAWNLDEGVVLFWGTGDKLTEALHDLFETTFDRGLETMGPAALALAEVGEERLATLLPTRQFVVGFQRAPEPASVAGAGDLRTRAFLGREFLTWLLFTAETSGASFNVPGGAVHARFGGKVTVRGIASEASDIPMKGMDPAASLEARAALLRGGTVTDAEIAIVQGESERRLVLTSGFDMKSVRLPELVYDEETARLPTRLDAIAETAATVDALFARFLRERLQPAWGDVIVPAMGDWLRDACERASVAPLQMAA